MGTLDDAIREHLELKRKHGADEAEIAELEDSAFGPPESPAEVTATAQEGQEAADVPVPAEASESAGEVEGVAPTPPETEVETDVTPAEQARQEYPQLQDTVSHEPVRPPEAVQSTEEHDALEISLFESEDEEEDFDIGEVDLDLGGEPAGEQPSAVPEPEPEPLPEPPAEPEPPVPEDTAEEHEILEEADEQITAGELEPVVDPDPTDESEGVAADPESAAGVSMPQPPMVDPDPTEEGHDVLEATPEFLKDAPSDDEAWFEQSEPKDFDFDDE